MPEVIPDWAQETDAKPDWAADDAPDWAQGPATPSLRPGLTPAPVRGALSRSDTDQRFGILPPDNSPERIQQNVESDTGPTLKEAAQEMGEVALHGPQGRLPRLGEKGTALRGATDAIASLVETGLSAEGIAIATGLAIPVVGEILALTMAGAGVKQAATDLGEASVTGDRETAARGATIGVVSLAPAAHVYKSAAGQQAAVRVSNELNALLDNPEAITRLQTRAESAAKGAWIPSPEGAPPGARQPGEIQIGRLEPLERPDGMFNVPRGMPVEAMRPTSYPASPELMNLAQLVAEARTRMAGREQGGQLSQSGQEFRSVAETPGFLQSAEQRIGKRPLPEEDAALKAQVEAQSAENAKLLEAASGEEAKLREEIAQLQAEADALKSQDEIRNETLRKRDSVEAVDELQSKPAETSVKEVNQSVGVNREPVPMAAGERTIFQELWAEGIRKRMAEEAAWREQQKQNANPPAEPPGEPKPGGMVSVDEALKAAEAAKGPEPTATKPSTTEPPKPGLISNTAAEAWADRVIKERGPGSGAVNAADPELFAAYLTKGVAHIERGVRSFGKWAEKMIAEHGEAVKPHLRALYEQALKLADTLGEDGRKMRTVSRRGTVAEMVPPVEQKALEVDPASYYRPQRVPTIEDRLPGMSMAELRQPLDIAKQGEEQNYVARQLELSRRLMADPGTRAEGYATFQQLAQAGTSFGQLVNQFKLLKSASPDYILELINRELAAKGTPPLDVPQRVQLRVLAGQNMKDIAAWRAAEERWASEPTRENVKRVDAAQQAAELSGRIFNERVQRVVPRGFWDVAVAKNVLGKFTLLSQERNVVQNALMMPFAAARRLPAVMFDMIDHVVTGRPREVALVPQHTLSGAGLALARSLPETGRIALRGSVPTTLDQTSSSVNLRPFVALKEILAGELMRNKPLATRLALLAEADPVSYFQAGMARGLNMGDVPARAAARGRLIAEAMVLEKKNARHQAAVLARKPNRTPEENARLALLRSVPEATGAAVRDAVRAPQLFLRPEVIERINREALGVVFQDPNKFTRWVLGIERDLPGPGRYVVRSVLPVISIPVNLAVKGLQWSPAGLVTAVPRAALRGDFRATKLALGDAIVGSMLWTAGIYLYQKGVISPALDSEDEQQKLRMLQGDMMNPNSINLSALNRLFKGESTAWLPGDETKDYSYLGMAGAQWMILSAIMRQREKNPLPGSNAQAVGDLMSGSALGFSSYMLNQTFLQGVRDMLDAAKSEKKMDSFLTSLFKSSLDIELPNQIESVNRAIRSYQREVKDDALDKRLQNALVSRLGAFTTADDKLPLKRDVWGRPLRQTPEGSNPWIYQIFDVAKSRVIPDDPIKLEIYNLVRRTGDLRAVPTPPDAHLSFAGQKVVLSPAQTSDLQERVGGYRKRIAEMLFSHQFLASSDEVKLSLLSKVWEKGNRLGTLEFLMSNPIGDLQEKPKPAGFGLGAEG